MKIRLPSAEISADCGCFAEIFRKISPEEFAITASPLLCAVNIKVYAKTWQKLDAKNIEVARNNLFAIWHVVLDIKKYSVKDLLHPGDFQS